MGFEIVGRILLTPPQKSTAKEKNGNKRLKFQHGFKITEDSLYGERKNHPIRIFYSQYYPIVSVGLSLKYSYASMDLIVSLENATIYQDQKPVLMGVNLSVEKGSFVFLIGRTGTGKSSLIKTLYGDLSLEEGSGSTVGFALNGLRDRDIPQLRRKIGVVFQDFKLLPDRNIKENLSFVLRATGWKDKVKIESRIIEVLQMIKVDNALGKFPFELSGGEQQRLAIARALLNEPELIIADEPTGNLDPQTSIEIMELFKELHQKGMTLLMATHDYNMILKYPGKIFQCEDGKIFEVVAQ